MHELALFAGAGGGILGGRLLGWSTVCAVELDSYCRNVLLARQRDGFLPRFPIWDDVRTFDGKQWRGHVDVISGGFPCQDISSAGRGAGIDGAHSGLWSEFKRIIGEVRPAWVFIENSPRLRTKGLVRVLKNLAELGYDARWDVFGAAHLGAPISGDECGLLPSCRASDADRGGRGDLLQALRGNGNSHFRLPTPTASLYGSNQGGASGRVGEVRHSLEHWTGGPWPSFREWMMGWPIGWTACAPLATDRFQEWLRWHGQRWKREPDKERD